MKERFGGMVSAHDHTPITPMDLRTLRDIYTKNRFPLYLHFIHG